MRKAVHTGQLEIRNVEAATEGLRQEFFNNVISMGHSNALTVANYILAIKHETASLSDSHRCNVIKALYHLSRYLYHKSFKSVTKDDFSMFLDSYRKNEKKDPMHKWIGTYNLYYALLSRFFRWLYYPNMAPNKRPAPKTIQNISRQKRMEVSTYKPTDLWTPDDDALFLKYCPTKRVSCYHVVSRDVSNRPHEVLRLKVGDLVYRVTPDKKQYYEILVNGKTGSRALPLFNSVPYIKDYLDHEHPQPNNQKAPLVCGEKGKGLGRHISVNRLFRLYSKLKKETFPKVLESPSVPQEDKDKIRELLKKPWNPYVRRHTGLTEKVKKIPALINQYAGWSLNSKMPAKYLHYFNNESSNGILEAYGYLPKDKELEEKLKPKICPQCTESNKPDAKWCTKCRTVLTFEGIAEAIEAENKKDLRITNLEKELKELSDGHDLLVQLYEADPQERNKLKLLYREADKNGTRKPGQLLYLKKEEYTPGSFAYEDYMQVSGEQS